MKRIFLLPIIYGYIILCWMIIYHLYKTRKFITGKKMALEEPHVSGGVVEIWGKSGIGEYLWQHVLCAELEQISQGLRTGECAVDHVTFRYRAGSQVLPSTVPQDTEYLVIVLDQVAHAQLWLNYLPAMSSLTHVALVLLGDEKCNNIWLTPYLAPHGGYLDPVFLVYDSPYIDNQTFFQWPLGVATYRNFPLAPSPDISSRRRFVCNFVGTVYEGSSRETLMHVISSHSLQRDCFVKPRYTWLAHEPEVSREEYIRVLSHSDLTLNPVGRNTECYRIYEAMALGSIPVVEDRIVTPSECGRNHRDDSAPLRMLKQYGAPVIYVKHWSELIDVLNNERKMSNEEKIKRRERMVNWYREFRHKLKSHFVSVIREKFEL